jgi:Ni,Fe-hydrogenase I cytochrome b subunit
MEELHLVRKKIYDPVLRIMHLSLGLGCLFLLASGILASMTEPGEKAAAIWDLHISMGYLFTAALLARFLWFLLGPAPAQLKALLHFRKWSTIIKNRALPQFGRSYGHDPLASIAYLGFYFVALTLSVTGILLAAIVHARGPFAKDLFDSVWLTQYFSGPHLLASIGIGAFVCVHMMALIYHEKKHKLPLTQAMISGYQYRHQSKGEHIHEENIP